MSEVKRIIRFGIWSDVYYGVERRIRNTERRNKAFDVFWLEDIARIKLLVESHVFSKARPEG